ncbi:MAG: peptidoglycan DD-metalloendopeptidase family protein [Clostridia bacterium]|nr:peptidoglycan DD-metalloendopeptidase family protein [Clostridia bacterium]
MKKLSLQLILPLLIAFIAVSSITLTSTTDIPAEAATLSEQKNQLAVLKGKYSEASKKAKSVKANLDKTRNEIKSNLEKKDELDAEIVALTEQIKAAEFLIAEYESAIAEKQAEKESLQKKKDEQYNTLGDMMKTSYMYGEDSYIDLILGSKDIGDFLRRLDFISYHMKYSKTVIDEMEVTTQKISEVSSTLEETLDAMTTLHAELEAARLELEPKLLEVEAIIAELNADESYMASQLEIEERDTLALEADIKGLEKKIFEEEEKIRKAEEEKRKKEEAERKRREEELGITSPSKSPASLPSDGKNVPGDGRIIWPINGYRPLTSSYGYRTDPITGKRAFHNGLDIAAPHGTNIYAAESGTVIRASRYDTYGECVMIDHGGGLITLYAHCSGYNVKLGQKVTQGDVIAFVGSTGRSTGNHLHFVVRINGQYMDPNDYLPKK